MAFAPGTRVGPYEVTALIGAGGMGEVYRGRDTTLNRDVALKILPEAFALDGDRIARFRREAQVLASLNHPNIAAIYGFEDSGSTHALVLELVEGPTLADQIAKGPIPLDEALPIAKQIAEALEAAHEQGIIHRDLKPANIKLRDDGTVKVLDFGLAKAMQPLSAISPAQTASPTITTPAQMTGVGMILGTAAYMSPEQAKGRPVDKRSDIWAFGCVLFEMLTGTRVFDGEDVADTLASVLKAEPHWSALSTDVPPAIDALLKRCLERDRQQRIGDIAAAKFVLSDPRLGVRTGLVATTPPPQPRWRLVIPVALTAAAIGPVGLLIGRSLQPALAPLQVTRFTYTLPADQRFTEVGGQVIAISRTGSHIAYVANRRIYLKGLSDLDARPVAGTDAGDGNERIGNIGFSPDGQSILFWHGTFGIGALKRIPLGGGAALTFAQAPALGGLLSFRSLDEGLILEYAREGIVRISANNRREVIVKQPGGLIAAPQILPDGDTLIYAVAPGLFDPTAAGTDTFDRARIVAHSIKSADEKTLVEGGGAPMYVSTGHLLYVAGGTLFAAPFDARRRVLTGDAVSVVEGVGRPEFTSGATPTRYYGVSENGTLLYIPGPASPTGGQFELALFDADGHGVPLKTRPGSYLFPRLSPDGKHVAFGSNDPKGAIVWTYDLSGTSAVRQLTIDGKNRYPVWSGDGTRIAFQSDREGDLAMYEERADGAAQAERLTKPATGAAQIPESWSPDGRTLLYSEQSKGEEFELWGLALPERKPFRFGDVRSMADPTSAMFSPDGKWVVYLATDKTGARNVFVEPFPRNGVKYPIGSGIWHPLWSADGKRLFYRGSGGREYVVSIATTPSFSISNPELLAASSFQSRGRVEREYDVTRDGRFLGIVTATENPGAESRTRPPSANRAAFGTAQQINVVLNWFEELKQRVPVK